MMDQNRIACCYYPTNLAAVDDRINFLNDLTLQLDELVVAKLFSDPKKALDELQKVHSPDVFTNKWISTLEDAEIEEEKPAHSIINVDIYSIRKEIFNPNRFDEISVMLVDYAMPPMTGLELCEQLPNSPIKKLMMTGEADNSIAVKAFNAGIIDKFITKDQPDFFEQINEAVENLQQKYFQDLSDVTIKTLSTNPSCCLNDPIFIEFFYNLFKENNFFEYYLLDSSGSFLFLDYEGNPSWLIVKSERDIKSFYNIAEGYGAPSDIVKTLEKREKVPFFLTPEDEAAPIEEWDRYLHPATELVGKNKYYYSFVKGPSVYDIQPGKIFSYKKYLDKVNSEWMSD